MPASAKRRLEQNRDEVKHVVRALLRALDFMYVQPRGSEKSGPQVDRRVGDG